jgi:hypothetical protein
LSKVIDAISRKNAVLMPLKPAHLRRDDTLSISTAIDIDVDQEEADGPSSGTQHHQSGVAESNTQVMKGYVTIRGQRTDVLEAIESLMIQAGDTTSALRRGLLTSAMHPGIHLAQARKSSSRLGDAGSSIVDKDSPNDSNDIQGPSLGSIWLQLSLAIRSATTAISTYFGREVGFGFLSLLGVCLVYYMYSSIAVRRLPGSNRRYANSKTPSGGSPSIRPRGFRMN